MDLPVGPLGRGWSGPLWTAPLQLPKMHRSASFATTWLARANKHESVAEPGERPFSILCRRFTVGGMSGQVNTPYRDFSLPRYASNWLLATFHSPERVDPVKDL